MAQEDRRHPSTRDVLRRGAVAGTSVAAGARIAGADRDDEGQVAHQERHGPLAGSRCGQHGRADVLIEDGVIREVGPSLRARNADVVDAADCIIMPGFVDAHRHVWRSITRNLDAASAVDLAAYFTPDDVYAATLVGLLQAGTGITTVVDWCDVSVDTAHHEAAASARRRRRRTVLVAPTSANTGDLTASTSLDIVEAELESIAALWARNSGQRIHAAPVPPGRPVAKSPESAGGLLGPHVTLSHCIRLSDADFDAIAVLDRGGSPRRVTWRVGRDHFRYSS